MLLTNYNIFVAAVAVGPALKTCALLVRAPEWQNQLLTAGRQHALLWSGTSQ